MIFFVSCIFNAERHGFNPFMAKIRACFTIFFYTVLIPIASHEINPFSYSVKIISKKTPAYKIMQDPPS